MEGMNFDPWIHEGVRTQVQCPVIWPILGVATITTVESSLVCEWWDLRVPGPGSSCKWDVRWVLDEYLPSQVRVQHYVKTRTKQTEQGKWNSGRQDRPSRDLGWSDASGSFMMDGWSGVAKAAGVEPCLNTVFPPCFLADIVVTFTNYICLSEGKTWAAYVVGKKKGSTNRKKMKGLLFMSFWSGSWVNDCIQPFCRDGVF